MTRHRYSKSIGVGIVIGAMIALLIGNTTTAILAGIIAAGLTAWMNSLQYSKIKEVALDVLDWIDLPVHLENMIEGTRNIPHAIGKAVTWPLSIIKRALKALITDNNARKIVLGTASVIIIMLPIISTVRMIGHTKVDATPLSINIFLIISFLSLAIITVLGAGSILSFWLFFFLNRGKEKFVSSKEAAVSRIRNHHSDQPFMLMFFTDWFLQLIEDDRGAMTATARMLHIRTGNALKIMAFPIVFIPWGAVALANNKTGASALAAMILSGLHLLAAHLAGGINTSNINFWLSLIVAMGLGFAAGTKIYEMAEYVKTPSFPRIKFRDQMIHPLHRGK